MGPEPIGLEWLLPADRVAYRVAVGAELAALQLAERRGIRLTRMQLDAVAAGSIHRDPAATAVLERRVRESLLRWSRSGRQPDRELALLDSLRAELTVWKVRAGP